MTSQFTSKHGFHLCNIFSFILIHIVNKTKCFLYPERTFSLLFTQGNQTDICYYKHVQLLSLSLSLHSKQLEMKIKRKPVEKTMSYKSSELKIACSKESAEYAYITTSLWQQVFSWASIWRKGRWLQGWHKWPKHTKTKAEVLKQALILTLP